MWLLILIVNVIDLESLWKHPSGCVYDTVSEMFELKRKEPSCLWPAPSHGLGSQTQQKEENQWFPSILLFLLPDNITNGFMFLLPCFSAMRYWTVKLWGKINPFLRYFFTATTKVVHNRTLILRIGLLWLSLAMWVIGIWNWCKAKSLDLWAREALECYK